MSSVISTNYRELAPQEIQQVAEECAAAWQDPAIPQKQFELAVKLELENYRIGLGCVPFDALVKCLLRLPSPNLGRLLDIGASGGYYREVLRLAGFACDYAGVDYSPAFKKLAERLYPGINFEVADARRLPQHDGGFDTVLSAACIMHLDDWQQGIQEAVRVSRKHIVLHRTPILTSKPTTAFLKEGYGVPMLEWHFNQAELLRLFERLNLRLIHRQEIFFTDGFGHFTYLLEKRPGLAHHSV